MKLRHAAKDILIGLGIAGLVTIASARGIFAKTDGNPLCTPKKQELTLPQSVKRFSSKLPLAGADSTFSLDTNYKGNVISLLPDTTQGSITAITSDSTAQKKTPPNNGNHKQAIDSSISINDWKIQNKKNYPNVIGMAPENWVKFSKRQQDEYIVELDSSKQRIFLPHDRKSYKAWKTDLDAFLQITSQLGEIQREKDSVLSSTRSDTTRMLRDDFVLEIVRLLPEADGSHTNAFFKRAITKRMLDKYAGLVKTYDDGLVAPLDTELSDRIDMMYAMVYDSTHNSHARRNDIAKFNDLLLYYIFDACSNPLNGSYKMSIDAMSQMTSWAYSKEEKKKIIAGSVKGIFGLFLKIRLWHGDLQALLEKHHEPYQLSPNALYELTAPQDAYERAEKLRSKMNDLSYEIANLKQKSGERYEKIGEGMGDLRGEIDGLVAACGVCGWLAGSYKELEKQLNDKVAALVK